MPSADEPEPDWSALARDAGHWLGPSGSDWLRRIGRGAGLGGHWEDTVLTPAEDGAPSAATVEPAEPSPESTSPMRRPRAAGTTASDGAGAFDRKGFRAALSARLAEDDRVADSVARLVSGDDRSVYGVRELPIDHIEVAGGLRTDDSASLAALVASVRQHGLLEPVLVRRVEADRYELLRGHRRLRAVLAAGLTEIPAVIRSVDPGAARALVALSPASIPIGSAFGSPRVSALRPRSGPLPGLNTRAAAIRAQLADLYATQEQMEIELAVVRDLTRIYRRWLGILEADEGQLQLSDSEVISRGLRPA